MTRFRFTLISELYLRESEGRATRKIDWSSAWPRDQLNSAQTILALLGIKVRFKYSEHVPNKNTGVNLLVDK